jgi:hypothetical protein
VSGVFRRLYLVRWRAAVLLCLPAVLMMGWYAFGAFARFDRLRRAEDPAQTLDLELFQLHLHDVLRRDLRRIGIRSRPDTGRIPHIELDVPRANMTTLLASRQADDRPYVDGNLTRDKQTIPVQMRVLGSRPWHVLHEQVSLKLRLPKGELLDGSRVFTLNNDPSPMVVGEQIILDLLAQRGILVPHSDFARVSINGSDRGVFRYEAQPDESVLRNRRREPGSLFSGDVGGDSPTDALWRGPERWKKVAWRQDAEKDDRRELERLIEHIDGASIRDFADFTRHEIDLEAFATFEAIDIAFGCEQHNQRENHKLYFDPYRGRWEPVAWGFRGFEHDPVFNRAEDPLLMRLKQVPGYLPLRNRTLYRFLTEDGSGAAVRARGLAIMRRVMPELLTDPYWDAYHLLPRITGFHRQMVRPMTADRASLVFDSELATYERRRDFLLDALRANPLWLRTRASRPASSPTQEAATQTVNATEAAEATPAVETVVDLIVDGESGVSLQRLLFQWPASCTAPNARLFVDERVLPASSHRGSATLEVPLQLLPAVAMQARRDADPDHGRVRSVSVPARYTLRVVSDCTPARIDAEGTNLSTLARVRAREAPASLLARLPERVLTAAAVPRFEPGEVASHTWALARHEQRTVTLGPGPVTIAQTRVFDADERVEVVAGTRLRMGADASLVFLGPVRFAGTEAQPIVIEPSGSSWGGLVLQGPATHGARLSYVHVRSGGTPSWRLVRYPATINLHDTRDIAIDNCHFEGNERSDDVVHTAYVHDLLVEDTAIDGAHADAWDLEFTTATLRRIRVSRAGDDAVDSMGSTVELSDAVLAQVGGNGVSAGEQSDIRMHDTLIANAAVGLLAKNESRVTVDDSLIYRAKTGVRVYTKAVRFEGDSSVQADVLFVVGSEQPIRRDDRGEQMLDIGRVQLRLPRRDRMRHLRDNVLVLDDWSMLPQWLNAHLDSPVRP